MTINFYLDSGNSSKQKNIYMYIRGIKSGKTIKIPTGEKCAKDLWNAKKGRVKQSALSALEINLKLDDYSSRANTCFRELTAKKAPTYNEIEKAIKAEFTSKFQESNLFAYYDKYISLISKSHSQSHFKRHKVVLNKIKKFCRKHGDSTLQFEDLSRTFFDSFCTFLVTDEKLLDHVALRYFRYFRMFVRYYETQGVHTVNIQYTPKFIDEKPKHVTLSIKELLRIQNLDLKDNKRLSNSRKIFFLQLHTGLRYGDLCMLNENSIDKVHGVIRITTSKTNAHPIIPITDEIDLILRDGFPRFISIQKQSKYLKELCRMAELNEVVELTRRRNGKLIKIVKPKWEFVGTHTLRRSKITLLDQQGFSVAEIMRHTGHKRQDQVLQYIQHDEKYIVNKLKSFQLLDSEE